MHDVPIVRVEGVSKHFTVRKDKSLKERVVNFSRSQRHKEVFHALRDIDLEIMTGSTVGLIGPNGSGKSTLLKTIGGIIQPSSGTVSRRGRMAALLELGAGFHPDLTGRENVFLNASILGLSERQTRSYFDDIVEFSGIADFIDTQVKFYSSGMYVRLAFAVAVHVDPDLLLVDEVLAVGDEAFQQKCLDKIRAFQQEGRTIVLVTHTMSQITDLCTRGVVLAKGSVVFDGDPTDAVELLRGGFRTQREFEAARAAERAHAPVEAAAPVVRERVEGGAVAVVGADGRPRSSFATGDDIAVEVSVDAKQRLERWNCAMQISNPLGQLVLFTTTDRMRIGVDPLEGRARYRFSLPDAQIGPGEYTVTIALYNGEETELLRMQDAARFRVVAGDRTAGPVATPVAFDRVPA
ncbi:ABC transporter ATP-binding protein [Agrococcus sp. HG114]|uniref:ABC transporter ATP-binding protein n=1 Tax=Agrococcus sp. HG114 TaxID=2969757 RepID=UPI00215A68F1|nr:ABC transporter ATP-binding protein [Agrococcus sp. HG114]MCR8670427.1 ABC transporter ATP-binding protein [Agrococcus sp. HG114]